MPGAEGFKGIENIQEAPVMQQSIEMPEFDMSKIDEIIDGLDA